MSSLSDYVRDPNWLPYEYADGSLRFVRVSRETAREAPFLDPRHLGDAPHSAPTPLTQLPSYAIERTARPVGFIFHTALCCSTLLTRALDVPGVSMGLKEPFVLSSLAAQPAKERGSERAQAALRMSVQMLSRPYASDEKQIIKPNNLANVIAGDMLDAHSESKAIVLYSPLDDFLRALSRKGLDGRTYARSLYMDLAGAGAVPAPDASDLILHTDLEIATQAWLTQARLLQEAERRFGPDRVRTLRADTLLANKAGVLERVGRFFDLKADAAAWRGVAAGPVFKQDAKRPHLSFSAPRLAQDDLEVSAVYQWAQAFSLRAKAPLNLGDTLMNKPL